MRAVCDIRRKTTRFVFFALFPQPLRVILQKAITEGPYADQSEISLQEVDQLGRFIQPETPQKSPPGGNPEIVLDLALIAVAEKLCDITLQILRIGMHGAHFVDVDGLAVLPCPPHFEQGAVGRAGVQAGLFDLSGGEENVLLVKFQAHEFEPAVVETSETFSQGHDPPSALGYKEKDFFQKYDFGKYPGPNKVKKIQNIGHHPGVSLHKMDAPEFAGGKFPDEGAPIDQFFIHFDKVAVEIALFVEQLKIHKKFHGPVRDDINIIGV